MFFCRCVVLSYAVKVRVAARIVVALVSYKVNENRLIPLKLRKKSDEMLIFSSISSLVCVCVRRVRVSPL